jgi:hypothetical protein
VKSKGRNAWLVLCHPFHEEYLDKLNLPTLACALPSTLGEGTVCAIWKTLWPIWMASNLEEKVSWGCSNQSPTKSFVRRTPGRSIYVGYDPYICAMKVENLQVLKSQSGNENLYFVIPAYYAGVELSEKIPAHPMVLKHEDRLYRPVS